MAKRTLDPRSELEEKIRQSEETTRALKALLSKEAAPANVPGRRPSVPGPVTGHSRGNPFGPNAFQLSTSPSLPVSQDVPRLLRKNAAPRIPSVGLNSHTSQQYPVSIYQRHLRKADVPLANPPQDPIAGSRPESRCGPGNETCQDYPPPSCTGSLPEDGSVNIEYVG